MSQYEREQHKRSSHHVQRERDFGVAGALFVGLGIFFLIWTVLLQGCPITITPPTEAVCPSRQNCGLCSSESVCVWCGSSGTCVGASSTTCDVETVVSIPEQCEGALPPGESVP